MCAYFSQGLTIHTSLSGVFAMMIFRFFRLGIYLLATNLFLTSGVGANNAPEDQGAWLESIHESWAEEDKEFKHSPTSPLAGISRFEISELATVYFAEKEGRLDWSPEQTDLAAFSLINTGGQWKWIGLEENVSLARKGQRMPSGSFLSAGDTLKVGRFTVAFYLSEDAITALVFDPNTQRLKEFKTLDRFDANAKFALTAKIVKFETPEQLDLITGLQRFKKQYRYAKLQFDIDGTELELTAYKHVLEGEGSNSLFIPFTDKTSGKYSYGGGRYLFVDEPQEGNEVPIDFNLVVNPLCSYASIYNCIVPTLENKLPVAILAGVKKYH